MNNAAFKSPAPIISSCLPPGGTYSFDQESRLSHQLRFADQDGNQYQLANIWYNRVLTPQYLETGLATNERGHGFLQLLIEGADDSIDRDFAMDYLSQVHGAYYQVNSASPITKIERAGYPSRYFGNKTFSLEASFVQKLLEESGLFEFTATSKTEELRFFLSAYDLHAPLAFNHDLLVNNHFDAIEPLLLLDASKALFNISRLEMSDKGQGWEIRSTNSEVQLRVSEWLGKYVDYWDANKIERPCDLRGRTPKKPKM